jgi:hypothetical protein
MYSAAAIITPVLFMVGAAWLATHTNPRARVATLLAAGFALVALAAIIRMPGIEEPLSKAIAPGEAELVKHLLIVAGCLLIAAFSWSASTSKPPPFRGIAIITVPMLGAMVLAFYISGPWTGGDLSDESISKPAMYLYWAIYFAGFVAAPTLYLPSIIRGFWRRQWIERAPLALAALGAIASILWAMLSVAKTALLTAGHYPVAIEDLRDALAAFFSVTLVLGLVGYITAARYRRRRDLRTLADLWAWILSIQPEIRRSDAGTDTDEYWMQIDVQDGLANLAAYTLEDDEVAVEAMRGLRAMQRRGLMLQLAATRLRQGARRRETVSDRWRDWASDTTSWAGVERARRSKKVQSFARSIGK